MSEGITYKDDGTIVVKLDKSYRLRIPMGEEVMEWHERLLSQTDEVQDRLDELTDTLAEHEEGTPAHREAAKALRRFSRRPAYDFLGEWMAEVFKSLCDDFPPEGDWPGWLRTNQAIPSLFIQHWRTVPKVSGSSDTK